MTPQERDWMSQLLGVDAPWTVQDVRVARADRAVQVQIGVQAVERPRLFGPRRAPPPTARRLHWSHTSLAGMRCGIVLNLPEGTRIPDAAWAGDPELPFTHGLSRLVLDLMLDGATMAQLCRLLELPLGDLWKYKFRLDQGSARAPQARSPAVAPAAERPAPVELPVVNPPPPMAPALLPPVAAAAESLPPLPPADAPVWLALLKGQWPLEVQALSLKLLLNKLMREAQTHQDADLHAQAAQSLFRYFVRNRSVLASETAQVLRAAGRMAGAALPEVSDPLWLAVLTGERTLDVRALGLRLLLSKLRQQSRGVLDDEVHMLKLVELHRFFDKHQAQLGHEIAQLRRWASH